MSWRYMVEMETAKTQGELAGAKPFHWKISGGRAL